MATELKSAGVTNGAGTLQQVVDSEGKYHCLVPGCGRTFTNPQGLGAHKYKAHGIKGVSKSTSSRTARKRQEGSVGVPRKRRAVSERRKPRSTSAVAGTDGATANVDKDKLLNLVFGAASIPPKSAAIDRVSAWLEEAEALNRIAG